MFLLCVKVAELLIDVLFLFDSQLFEIFYRNLFVDFIKVANQSLDVILCW